MLLYQPCTSHIWKVGEKLAKEITSFDCSVNHKDDSDISIESFVTKTKDQKIERKDNDQGRQIQNP